MFDSLRSFSNQQILANTDAIVVQDRKLTLRLLGHLHEIERRKLYLKRGYGSMFDYCTTHLRLSEPAAARRLRVARCLARFPQVGALLESGDVNLSTMSMVAKFMTPDNVAGLLERIRGRSRRQVEAVVAELGPLAATLPPDRIRTIVVSAAQTTIPTTAAAPQFTVAGDSEKSPSPAAPMSEDRRAGDHEKSPGATVSSVGSLKLQRRAVIQFTTREEVITKLERVRSLASHRLSGGGSLDEVIDFLAEYFITREDPATRHRRRERRARKPGAPGPTRSARAIPARVRDQVFVRDKQQCTYVSPNGKRCASTHALQVDHIQPIARGGPNTIDNLRILCAQHNRMEAERLMGRCGPGNWIEEHDHVQS